MQQSIVKFISFSYRHCSTCFGHHNAHYQEPVKLPSQPLVSLWMWRWKCSQPFSRLRTLPPPHSYGNQRLRRQFDELLMMGIVMPETCWAVSVRQSNKFYDWLLHLVGCFIWVKTPRWHQKLSIWVTITLKYVEIIECRILPWRVDSRLYWPIYGLYT